MVLGAKSFSAGFSQSKSLHAALAFSAGGIGFSLASLLLARYLSATEFGMLALLLALIQIGIGVGPAGIDLVINRRSLSATATMARRVIVTSVLTSTAVTVGAAVVYKVPVAVLPALWIAVTAASFSKVGASFFQSRGRFTASLCFTQCHNYVLLISLPLAIIAGLIDLEFFATVIAAGYILTAVTSWYIARQSLPRSDVQVDVKLVRQEGLSGLGIGLAILLLAQTERFLIPLVLSYQEMAEFGVLAAVAIAPFRMMQLAVGFTMLPRLRLAETASAARRMISIEATIAAVVALCGAAAVGLLGPYIITAFVGDKYDISPMLFVAAIAVGLIRMTQALSVATVNALGNAALLSMLNRASWASLATAIVAAWLLAVYGLAGVILGVGLGWLLQTLVAIKLALRAFRERYSPQ